MKQEIKKSHIVLAALTSSDIETPYYSPVQVQKLLFLVDQLAAEDTEGPHFDFQACHYGPFDKDVYRTLERLAGRGFVEIHGDHWGGKHTYRLTDVGLTRGKKIREEFFTPEIRDYLAELSKFVRNHSFTELVSAIYKAFPDMKINSVFTS